MHRGAVTRRELLAGAVAAVGLGTLAPLSTAEGVTGAGHALGSTGPRRLDLHHHFGCPRWVQRDTQARTASTQRMLTWTPARSIELMDAGDVQTAFVSCTYPGVWFGDDFDHGRDEAIALSREMNEFGAKMKSDYRGRFGLFAVLPLPDVDASLSEIEYAFDVLHADGVGVFTSYSNMWLGDVRLQPVFDELNRRAAVVFVHPTDAACCHALAHATPETVEWLSDTGRSINSLVSTALPYDGGPYPNVRADRPRRESAATRYSKITFVWSHGGGSLIGIADRVVGDIEAQTLVKPTEVNSGLYHLRRFYYDTAGSANPVVMQALMRLVGTTQIVFGADVPFGTPAHIGEQLAYCGFTPEVLQAIDRQNALRFLPAYRTV
jgi:predicted TIM-barrel fold metal-dependent hydrolase